MAVVGYGAPLKMLDLPSSTPGPREARVAVEYCGVCGTDLKIVAGALPFSPTVRLPHVPGHEIVGVIDAVGPDTRIEPGTRVVLYDYGTCGTCRSCSAGRETTCSRLGRRIGFTDPGGFQERLTIPEELAIPVPGSVSARAAAAISCAVGTAYRATVTLGQAGSGSRVAVLGAGGVGIHAIQIAAAVGAEVVVAEPSPSRRHAALAAGAVAAVAPEELPALGKGREIDVVIDTSGRAGIVSAGIALVAPGGRVVLVGYAPGEAIGLDAQDLVLREVSVLGSRYATRADLTDAIALVARGAVHPVVGEVFTLTEANAALAAVQAGRVHGRVAVAVSGP
jgi:2-desacetyl-2-hydroxyethyl bacteriochlorophyllide A dehydrogenase